MRINNYVIELINDWQLSYGLIYSLSLMELETLKTYIKNNFINGFIKLSKSSVEVLIFIDKKSNSQ